MFRLLTISPSLSFSLCLCFFLFFFFLPEAEVLDTFCSSEDTDIEGKMEADFRSVFGMLRVFLAPGSCSTSKSRTVNLLPFGLFSLECCESVRRNVIANEARLKAFPYMLVLSGTLPLEIFVSVGDKGRPFSIESIYFSRRLKIEKKSFFICEPTLFTYTIKLYYLQLI